jgi:DNA polymerase III epsilon subunit-like protein/preprotein translocase subunit SecG
MVLEEDSSSREANFFTRRSTLARNIKCIVIPALFIACAVLLITLGFAPTDHERSTNIDSSATTKTNPPTGSQGQKIAEMVPLLRPSTSLKSVGLWKSLLARKWYLVAGVVVCTAVVIVLAVVIGGSKHGEENGAVGNGKAESTSAAAAGLESTVKPWVYIVAVIGLLVFVVLAVLIFTRIYKTKECMQVNIDSSLTDDTIVTSQPDAGALTNEVSGRRPSPLLALFPKPPSGHSPTTPGKYIALDCEFVGVGKDGKENALARVTFINYYGRVVMDKFVKPDEPVTDYRTAVSGIKPGDLDNGIRKIDALKMAKSLIGEKTVLVGHGLEKDLQVLGLQLPPEMIRDTSEMTRFRQGINGNKKPSLKHLAQRYLNVKIQQGEHDSAEDARAAMLLFQYTKRNHAN